MTIIRDTQIAQIKDTLAKVLPDRHRLFYDAHFPRPNGTTFSWLQIVFVVGPADDESLRVQVHSLFPDLLTLLHHAAVAQLIDSVSLRARRRYLDNDHFPMFIEASWDASCLTKIVQHGESWQGLVRRYVNRFNDGDPLTRWG